MDQSAKPRPADDKGKQAAPPPAVEPTGTALPNGRLRLDGRGLTSVARGPLPAQPTRPPEAPVPAAAETARGPRSPGAESPLPPPDAPPADPGAGLRDIASAPKRDPRELAAHMRAEAERFQAIVAKGGSPVDSCESEYGALLRALDWRAAVTGAVVNYTPLRFTCLPDKHEAAYRDMGRELTKGMLARRFPEIEAFVDAFNAKKPGRCVLAMRTTVPAFNHALTTLGPGENRTYVVLDKSGSHAVVLDIRRHPPSMDATRGEASPVTWLAFDPIKVIDNPDKEALRHELESDYLAGLGPMRDRVTAGQFVFTGTLRDMAGCIGLAKDALITIERFPGAVRSMHQDLLLDHPTGEALDASGCLRFYSTPRAMQSHQVPIRILQNLQSSGMAAELLNARPWAWEEPLNPLKKHPELREETFPQRLERITGQPWVQKVPGTDGKFEKVPGSGLTDAQRTLLVTRNYQKMYRDAADRLDATLPAE